MNLPVTSEDYIKSTWSRSNLGKKVTQVSFRIFRLIGWFAEYDFWNLWKILDRHRCSENFRDFFFEMKNFSRKLLFGKMFFFPKMFEKFRYSIGIWMIPFITRYKGNHQNPYRIWEFFRIFWKCPIIFKNIFFEKMFSSRKKILIIFLDTYVDPKFSKDSKNHTYTEGSRTWGASELK